MWEKIQNALWSEKFWLPPNSSWVDYENSGDGIYIPQIRDLILAFVVGPGFFFARLVFERYIFRPIGLTYIKDTRPRKADKNEILEELFRKNRAPNDSIIQGLSKQTDLQERYIQRWFRIRRNQERSSGLKKFTEGSWRFTVYLILLIFGTITLWDKPWFADSSLFWAKYPHQHVSNDLYWYYLLEIGFYFSLIISQFRDVKRKDFTMMLIHHCFSLSLLGYSWITNNVRIGSHVLIIHDCCDPLLELAKLTLYLKLERLCNVVYVLFTVTWFITRIFIFPYMCIWSALFVAPKYFGWCPAFTISSIIFVLLFFLHLIWTKFLVQSVIKSIRAGGKIEKDERSEDDESISDETEESLKNIRNGRM